MQVPGDLVCKLAGVATSCGATLFMALMTTWQVCNRLDVGQPLLLWCVAVLLRVQIEGKLL